MNVEARLRAFAAIAREGSITGAAERLYVSQPAVSKHLASLEAELGTALVVRDRRGARLTPTGEVLADYVLRAEALLANARRALAAGAESQLGTLSLAASGIPGTYLLPEVLARFHEQHPAVEIDFRLSTSGEALELVRSHEVELAVVGGLTLPPELQADELLEDEVVLIGPPALGGRRLRAKELEGLTWITREEGSATREAVEAARWQVGLRAVRTLELPSWEAVKRAVASGAGVAAISRVGLDHEVDAGALIILDVPRWRLSRTISVVTAREVPLTPPAERFLALLRERFAPAAEPLPPNSNLPALATVLLGRQRELEEISELVRREALVTLTGPGGSGKTRLALEVASRLVDDFEDGVFLVELAGLRDAKLVVPTVAHTLGVEEAALEERLRGQRVLLLLDNFEHVVDAAAEVAKLGATKLITSRARLGVASEHEYEVVPLGLDAAVELFVERARAAQRGFRSDDAVPELCERLDKLPLAIELAAARVKTLPPAALLDRVDRRLGLLVGGRRDVADRQRTLRATIEWSYELLEEPERSIFPQLAAFAGGWTLEAAEAVCDADPPALAELVDEHLVRQEGDRFGMLETVREFAAERFENGRIRRRHAEYFLRFAETARSYARGPEAIEWLSRTATELDNLRVALQWALEHDAALGLTLMDALEPLWVRGIRHREGVRWFEQYLALDPSVPPAVLAGALATAGRLAFELGEIERSRPWNERALEVAEAADEKLPQAWALHGLARAAQEDGDPELARARFERSAELFLELGHHGPAGGRFTYLAELARSQGDLEGARAYFERARTEYGTAGDLPGVAAATHGLGDVALDMRRPKEALSRYVDALELVEGIEDPYDIAHCLGGIAAVTGSARLWGAALELASGLDTGLQEPSRAQYERKLGQLDERELAAGKELSVPEAIALARELSS
jgi:DNA-binding transcriptional LysR family regulator/predicted ATPase